MYALSPRRMHPRTAMTLALLAALAMWVFAATPAKAGYYPPVHSDAAYYYDSLAPYGTWTHHASYGAVWYPRGMAHDWRPYTHGRWVWDDGYGWTWASGFAWGWAPFHYGNWVWDAAFGWIWVPGRVWAPAWVTWRYSDSYVGWAPIGFGVSYWSYNPGWNYGGWSYVHRHHFGAPVVHQHIIVVNNYKTIYQNTRHWAPPRNKYNRVEHRGFDRGFVERGSRYKIDRVHAQPDHWQRNDHRAGTPQRNDWRDGRQATRNDGARQAAPERRIDGYVDGRRDPQWNGRQESQRQTSDQLRQRQLHEQQRRQQQAQPPQRQRETQERRPPPQQAQQHQRQQQLQEQQRRMQQAQPQQRQREMQERRPPQQAQQQQRQPQLHEQQRRMQQAQPQQRQREMQERRPPPQQAQRQQRPPQMQEQQRRPQQAQPPQRQRETQERRLAQQQPRAPQMQRQPEGRYEQRAERRDEGGGRDGGRSWR